jgi:hypothetical protein
MESLDRVQSVDRNDLPTSLGREVGWLIAPALARACKRALGERTPKDELGGLCSCSDPPQQLSLGEIPQLCLHLVSAHLWPPLVAGKSSRSVA